MRRWVALPARPQRGSTADMGRTCLLILVGLSLGAGAASAASKKEAEKPKAAYVDLQTIGFPAVIQGRLVNYVFVKLRLNVAAGVDASKIQEEEPFLRDSLVRASSHTPFNPPDNAVRLDDARLKAEVMKAARAQFGAGKVVSVEINSETPQKRSGVPGAAGLPYSGPPPG